MNSDLSQSRYQSSFEHYLGVDFKLYDDSACEIELLIKPEHLNIGGTVHGGIISSLLDIALSGAITARIKDRSAEQVVTLQMNVNFLRAANLGDRLIAHGRVIKQGSTIAYIEGEIINQDSRLIAKASGDWFIKKANAQKTS